LQAFRRSASAAGACGLLLGLLASGCHCWSPVTATSTVVRQKEVPGAGDYTWDPARGWIMPRRGGWGTPSQIQAEANKALSAGAHAEALEAFLALRRALPDGDPALGETNLHIAECYHQLGDYGRAVEYYAEVYRKNKPPDALLRRAFQGVHDIAMDYVRGKAGCAFLIDAFRTTGPAHGRELLLGERGLLTEYPYLEFADDAIMEIARQHYDEKEYEEAITLYERIVRDYPRSEWRELAQYQLAISIFDQIRGVDYDQQLMNDADRKFRMYLEDNPRGKRAEDARAKVREISEMQGEAYLRKAKFYLRESQVIAAKRYLTIILERYTTTKAAQEAREIQRQIARLESAG